MYQLKIGTIPLPKIYVCEPGTSDSRKARELGVPYLVKPRGWSDDKLVKAVLWRFLHQKFPDILWNEVLGFTRKPAIKVQVPAEWRENPGFDTCGSSSPNMEDAGDYRETGGGLDEGDTFANLMAQPEYETMGIDDYIGDLGYYVDVDELQALGILPTFLDDIANAIKKNLWGLSWMDGYNKKLDAPLGYHQGQDEAPNLIILDTSGSIPSGVAGTMVSLIETLRNQANADLIITSGRSEYWRANEPLPSPDDLSYLIGGCNECRQFYHILRTKVLGRHWGNVIVFGDWDAPEDRRFNRHSDCWLKDSELQSTRIDNLMAFHTSANAMPGYGRWAEKIAPDKVGKVNTDWVKSMKKPRWW